MDRIRDILNYFLAAMAVFTFLSAVYEAMNQRIASAVVLAGLMLVAVVLFNFPQLEVLKAFSVEVRLRQTLDRAEEILGRIKRLSVIDAKVTYMTMAWGNRMGAPTAKEKQAILDEMDAQLSGMNVTDDERRDIARPLVDLIGVDLYQIYNQVMARFLMWKEDELARSGTTDPNYVAKRQAFANAMSEWRKTARPGPYESRTDYNLADFLNRAGPSNDLADERERAAFAKLRDEIITLFDGCRSKGGYTPEAANFYDAYSSLAGADLKLRDLLGVSP